MFKLKTIIALIATIAIAATGVPVQAASVCAMKAGTHHMMIKHCPGCVQKSETQKNKCCDSMGCMVNCSSASNTATYIKTAFLPVKKAVETVYLHNDTVTSFFIQTQERPPKHLA